MDASAVPSRPRGRPRRFDRDAALLAAMRVFWEQGFEAASMTELTEAMGINPPSLYAAFGDKRRLYGEALQRYQERVGCFVPDALAGGTTAQEALANLLARAAEVYAAPGEPKGCMVIHAALPEPEEGDPTATLLRAAQGSLGPTIEVRLRQGQADGDLPAAADVPGLARFYAAVLQGMSTQARQGASAEELARVAEQAMHAWPVGG